MPMIRCSANEHYFDNDKHSKCPFCTSGKKSNKQRSSDTPRGDDEKTKSTNSSAKTEFNDNPPPADKTPNSSTKEDNNNMKDNDPKTTASWQRKKENKESEHRETDSSPKQEPKANFSLAPVVGWLVVVEGEERGRDFRVIPGINNIGRDSANDIAIDTGDLEISRDKHSIIEFDVKNSKFYLERGTTATYLNDNRVGGDGSELVLGDIIEIGATKLKFIPFCSSEYCWDM